MGLDLVEELLNGIIDSAPQLAETAVELVGQLIQGLAGQRPGSDSPPPSAWFPS